MQDIRLLPVFRKFVKCVEDHHLFTRNTNIILGVSGGADSVSMLLLTYAYMNAEYLTVAHMNHGIRGDEAIRDETYVRDLCTQLGVEFRTEYQNIPQLATEYGMGIEETAREFRYQFLQRIAEEKKGIIAIAHNREDRAETILMNIARGCSCDGLKGIAYKNGKIVRPLLDLSREEIEEICKFAGIEPVTDSTNLSDCTLRNKVRHRGIPFLTDLFNQDIRDKLIHLSESASRDVFFLEKYTESQLDKIVSHEDNKIVVDRLLFIEQEDAIRYRIARHILMHVQNKEGLCVYPEGKDLTGDILHRIVNHISNGTSGRMVECGRGVQCLIEHNQAVLYCLDSLHSSSLEGKQVLIETFDRKQLGSKDFIRNKKESEEFFDQKVIDDLCVQYESEILVRYIRAGDRFQPFGGVGHTTVQKFLIDHKIPVSKRKQIVLVCVGDEIIWIPGLRRSEIGRITEHTDRIMKITIESEALYYGNSKQNGCS